MTKITILIEHQQEVTYLRAFDWFQDQRPWITVKGHYTIFDVETEACLGLHP